MPWPGRGLTQENTGHFPKAAHLSPKELTMVQVEELTRAHGRPTRKRSCKQTSFLDTTCSMVAGQGPKISTGIGILAFL